MKIISSGTGSVETGDEEDGSGTMSETAGGITDEEPRGRGTGEPRSHEAGTEMDRMERMRHAWRAASNWKARGGLGI